MPISYTLDKPRRQIRTTVTGAVTVDEILKHFEAVGRDDLLSCAELIDARSVAEPYLSGGEVRRAAEKVVALCGTDKSGARAVLVSNTVVFGLARMFTTFVVPHFHMEVFRDANEAADWLATWSPPN